jgi:hypothetical protein
MLETDNRRDYPRTGESVQEVEYGKRDNHETRRLEEYTGIGFISEAECAD